MVTAEVNLNELFTCNECHAEKPRSEAHYPTAQKPAMCKVCSKLRRQKGTIAQKRTSDSAHTRITLGLSNRHQAILSAIASNPTFESKSRVVESALDALLDRQPQQVKDFVRFLESQA